SSRSLGMCVAGGVYRSCAGCCLNGTSIPEQQQPLMIFTVFGHVRGGRGLSFLRWLLLKRDLNT
ncbi:hypothetical protein, partial [Enterobacter hormaechei]|uniref:hypothetical protein n=1 Tax=Enterobacter hormaechei TaxID=158836 RepID=UPI00197A9D7E